MSDTDTILAFACNHGLLFEPKGTIGFGRPCVGLLDYPDGSYVAYQPYTPDGSFDTMAGFEDSQITECAPDGAYHKGDYLAVLYHDDCNEDAIAQLAQWCRDMDRIRCEIVDIPTSRNSFARVFSKQFTTKAIRPLQRIAVD